MIAVFIIAGLVFISLFYTLAQNKRILSYFKDDSVCVFGKKGKGKDILFQYVIRKQKVRPYSNTQYGDYNDLISIKDLQINNTFANAINEEWRKCDNYKIREGADIFISDCGVYLPSQYYSTLDKLYPDLPLFMAVSRHLSDSNVHINTQNIGRVWDKVREQCGYFIQAKGTTVIGRLFITRLVVYDRADVAERGVLPFKPNRKRRKAEIEAQRLDFVADYGFVKAFRLFQILPRDHYDSRFFRKKILAEPEKPRV